MKHVMPVATSVQHPLQRLSLLLNVFLHCLSSQLLPICEQHHCASPHTVPQNAEVHLHSSPVFLSERVHGYGQQERHFTSHRTQRTALTDLPLDLLRIGQTEQTPPGGVHHCDRPPCHCPMACRAPGGLCVGLKRFSVQDHVACWALPWLSPSQQDETKRRLKTSRFCWESCSYTQCTGLRNLHINYPTCWLAYCSYLPLGIFSHPENTWFLGHLSCITVISIFSCLPCHLQSSFSWVCITLRRLLASIIWLVWLVITLLPCCLMCSWICLLQHRFPHWFS